MSDMSVIDSIDLYPRRVSSVASSAASEIPSASTKKAVVVGIYGIPGSGKSFLLGNLKKELGKDSFQFYDGSQVIAGLFPGGLDAFHSLDEERKVLARRLAIHTVGAECASSGRVGVVAGHFMFWPEGDGAGHVVQTDGDLLVYTHILYLDASPERIARLRQSDKGKERPPVSTEHLRRWQLAEKTQLRRLCRDNGILFSLVPDPWHVSGLGPISTLLLDFRDHTEAYNTECAMRGLDQALDLHEPLLERVLVIDADKTLTAEDTGTLFWKMAPETHTSDDEGSPLKTLFGSPLGYSHTAFRQAVLLYEETVDEEEFDALCDKVASAVTIHAEFHSLLAQIAGYEHVKAVVATCGLRRVWQKVLERAGLANFVPVIGGGRVADGFVVTGQVKGMLVSWLRDTHGLDVWAFGDSVLDLPMLKAAHQAVVVVGEERTRSKSMDPALLRAIDDEGLCARQSLLPRNATPRLDLAKLPVVDLTDPGFIEAVLGRSRRRRLPAVLHATDRSAAKLLSTPMRDAAIFGPGLRTAHEHAGWYLAVEFLSEVLGVEEYTIPHVQGHQTSGHRLRDENQTTIVALMRGGEPMALGISRALPTAMFVHASRPDDVKLHHVQQRRTILLVDSVVNSGKTVVEFVEHIRRFDATIRVVVVAGVVQAQAASKGSLANMLADDANLDLVALRRSENKFTGTGTTDTGNRLFNTTHLA